MVKCSNCLLVLWWRQVMGGERGREETIIFLDHPAMMMIILIIIATNIVIIISGTHSTFYHPFIHLIKLKHLAARIRKSLLPFWKVWKFEFLNVCHDVNTLYFVEIEFWRQYLAFWQLLWIFLTVTDKSALPAWRGSWVENNSEQFLQRNAQGAINHADPWNYRQTFLFLSEL